MGNLTDIFEFIKHLLVISNPVLFASVSLYEGMALLMAIAGLWYTHRGICQAKLRQEQLRQDGRNGVLKLTADENLRVERNRRNELLCVFVIALIAAVVPSRQNPEFNWAGSAVSLIIMGWIWLLSSNAYMSEKYREEMAKELGELDTKIRMASIKGGRRKEDKSNADEMGLSDS